MGIVYQEHAETTPILSLPTFFILGGVEGRAGQESDVATPLLRPVELSISYTIANNSDHVCCVQQRCACRHQREKNDGTVPN